MKKNLKRKKKRNKSLIYLVRYLLKFMSSIRCSVARCCQSIFSEIPKYPCEKQGNIDEMGKMVISVEEDGNGQRCQRHVRHRVVSRNVNNLLDSTQFVFKVIFYNKYYLIQKSTLLFTSILTVTILSRHVSRAFDEQKIYL